MQYVYNDMTHIKVLIMIIDDTRELAESDYIKNEYYLQYLYY